MVAPKASMSQSKDESILPKISIYTLLASCFVDSIERRTAYIEEIPGAFLQSIWPTDQP